MNPLLILPAALALSSVLLSGSAAPDVTPAVAPGAVSHAEFARVADMKPGAKFLADSAEGSMIEVKLGELAKEKAQDEQVKGFADKMIQDHTQALSDIRALASKKDITLPTDLDAKAEKEKDKLSGLDGAKFDKAYMRHMVMDHRQDKHKTNDMQDDLKDPEIKALSEKLEAVYKEHLELAKKIQKSLKD